MGDLARGICIICIIGKAYAIRFFVAISLPRQSYYKLFFFKIQELQNVIVSAIKYLSIIRKYTDGLIDIQLFPSAKSFNSFVETFNFLLHMYNMMIH